MRKKEICNDCKFTADCLENISNRYSNTYTFLVFLSILGGVIVLTNKININIINWIIGLSALISTILLQLFKDKIEKIRGYQELSLEFRNLEQDIQNYGNTTGNQERMKLLRKKLADYPIDNYTKRRIKKKNEDK